MDSSEMARVKGDGGNAPATEEEIRALKDEIAKITRNISNTSKRKDLTRKYRYCLWNGQSSDGRKHRQDIGKDPFPFEGATDGRIRLTDMIAQETVMVLVAAASRAQVRVKGTEIADEAKAAKLSTLLNWQINNNIGRSEYLRQITLLAQYMVADSPAGAVLGVYWEREDGVRLEKLSLDQFVATVLQATGSKKREDLQDLLDLVMNPERGEEAAGALMALLPELRPARAKRMVRELREKGECAFPRRYRRLNRPKIRAERIFETIYFPVNTTDIQRARAIFMPEWFGRAEVVAMAAREGWRKEFTAALLGDGSTPKSGHEEKSAFEDSNGVQDAGDITTEENRHEDEFEIITALWKAVTEDGVLATYMVKFHGDLPMAATERQLLDYDHGQYPLTYFAREILSARLLDSRGVPEVSQTEQETLKLLHDLHNDRAQLVTVPPLFTPMNRGGVEVTLQPLGLIPRRKRDDYEWMSPPAATLDNASAMKFVKAFSDEYHGRRNNDLPGAGAEGWALAKQSIADRFLAGLQDAFKQLLQLCLQYMDDSEMARVMGGDPIEIARTVEEIQGCFDLQLSFDVRDLDQEYLLKLAEAISKWVLPMDNAGTVMRDRLVQRIMASINPNLAEETTRPIEDANQAEATDEENNFAKIAAGIEPVMVKDGLNFGLRYQKLLEIGQKNPEAFAKLTPVSRQILEKRLEYLQFQVEQEKNKIIGALGTTPALEEPAG